MMVNKSDTLVKSIFDKKREIAYSVKITFERLQEIANERDKPLIGELHFISEDDLIGTPSETGYLFLLPGGTGYSLMGKDDRKEVMISKMSWTKLMRPLMETADEFGDRVYLEPDRAADYLFTKMLGDLVEYDRTWDVFVKRREESQ